jgi:hypothetical protein
VKSGISKLINYDGIKGIIQEEKENPKAFYDRLEEALIPTLEKGLPSWATILLFNSPQILGI